MNNETNLELSIQIAEEYATYDNTISAESLIAEIKNSDKKPTKRLFEQVANVANVISIGSALYQMVKITRDIYARGKKDIQPKDINEELTINLNDILSDEEKTKIQKIILAKIKESE